MRCCVPTNVECITLHLLCSNLLVPVQYGESVPLFDLYEVDSTFPPYHIKLIGKGHPCYRV